jgi:GDPmannose 4,6-dehydratase
MKKSIISGVTGQDGSYLAELLLEKNHEVYGIQRRSSSSNLWRIDHLLHLDNFNLIEGEVTDSGSVYSIIEEHQPDEIYNLAAQSHVKTSFDQPNYTFQVDTIGVLNFLEGIRKYSIGTKFYQASTSEMFGSNYQVSSDGTKYQDEDTEFSPNSPYAVAKLAAHNMVDLYRRSYGIHACCGILFNHESERRGENFVTRKITKWIGEFYNWFSNLDDDYSCLDLRGDV